MTTHTANLTEAIGMSYSLGAVREFIVQLKTKEKDFFIMKTNTLNEKQYQKIAEGWAGV